MAEAANLHVVDTASGVIAEGCEACVELKRELNKALSDARTWHRRYENEKEANDQAARKDAAWPTALGLFREWAILLNHTRCEWDRTRFELVRPFIRKDKVEGCRRAIAGYWYDAWLAPARRNGKRRRVDEWDYIFRDRANFEEGVNKAPENWEALFMDEATLTAYAAVPYGERKPPPAPAEPPPPPGSLFAGVSGG